MNEAIKNFMPGEDITTEKGKAFAVRILDFMRDRLKEYQEETGSIYNLEATPGEGTTYRFARMDKKRFGKIVVANDDAVQRGAQPYYTNSSQLPVDFTDDVFEALDLQDDLQCKYTGGTVFHTFIGERMTTDAVKKMVKKIANNYRLPYFTVSPTFSICPNHGYLSGEHEYCPKCDLEIAEGKRAAADDVVAEEEREKKIASVSTGESEVVAEEVKPVAIESREEKKVVSAFGDSEVEKNDDVDDVAVVESEVLFDPSANEKSKLKIRGDTYGEN